MPIKWPGNTNERLAVLRTEVIEKHPMALFLGSGVSRGCGLPLWDELCERVLCLALREIRNSSITQGQAAFLAHLYTQLYTDGHLAVMQYARDLLGDDFAENVRTVLYENHRDPGQEALDALSRAITSEKFRTIVTYNYDDLLETILRDERGVGVQVVTRGEDLKKLDRSRDDVLMYYVHGRVPNRRGDSISQSVVATEGSYHELRQRELDWRNLIQLQILTTTRVLFIGLSLNDPNLRWLMKICHQETHRTHYAVDVVESCAHLKARIERTTKVSCDAETAITLNYLRVDARERLGKHLGIDFLWLNDWSELAELIRYVFPSAGCV